jgi:hypothetical protein
MILSGWELWACANECIRQHGADAATHAATRADNLVSEGNDSGGQHRRLIAQRISDLTANATGTRH